MRVAAMKDAEAARAVSTLSAELQRLRADATQSLSKPTSCLPGDHNLQDAASRHGRKDDVASTLLDRAPGMAAGSAAEALEREWDGDNNETDDEDAEHLGSYHG